MSSKWTEGWPALLAVLLIAPALAGCLGNAQATAMEHRDTAEAHAAEETNNPRIVKIVGAEGTFSGMAGMDGAWTDADYWDRARDDPNPGDGHAEIWVYQFVGEDDPDTLYTVVLDRDGEVVAESQDARDGEDPIGEWNVDSDEAMETAKEANDGLREGLSADNHGVALILEDDGSHANPTWRIAGGGGGADGAGGGTVLVDAVTGEVLESEGGSWSGSR